MNAASQINAAASRKPRTRPAPSSRDQQIYLDYQTSGKLQDELAEQYGLTQCRISQIIRRVEKWVHATPENLRYLRTKRDRMGHDLAQLEHYDQVGAAPEHVDGGTL